MTSSPSSVKRKLRRKSRQSFSPANREKPPPNGLSLKKSSKTAGSWSRPARQYAYAMVNWYRSVRSGGTRSRIDRSIVLHVSVDRAAMFSKSWSLLMLDLWDLQFPVVPLTSGAGAQRKPKSPQAEWGMFCRKLQIQFLDFIWGISYTKIIGVCLVIDY